MKNTKTNAMPRMHAFPHAALWGRMLIFFLIVLSAGFSQGCKSQKKAAAKAAEEERLEREARIAEARETLLAIIEDEGDMSVAEKERKLQEIKDQNLNDPQIDALIARAEEVIARERRAMEDIEEAGEMSRESELSRYFTSIANANSTSAANGAINEALQLFASPDVPVLVIIYEEGNTVDYDEPTTIRKYLNYLKDQKTTADRIVNMKVNNSGKITELELKKQ